MSYVGLNKVIELTAENAVDEVTFSDLTSDGKPIVLRPADRIIVRFPDGKVVRVEFMTAFEARAEGIKV